jgi:hypothetical protein
LGALLLVVRFLIPFTSTHHEETAYVPVKKQVLPPETISDLGLERSFPSATSSKGISFVVPVAAGDSTASPLETASKIVTPGIANIRFAAYRCEISNENLRMIYQNGSQRELKWYEINAIVVRQLPYEEQWEGRLILDIIPNSIAKEKVRPFRILSNTFVNYAFLPQGQSASTRENIRRLAAFALSQHRSIYLDPGTDYFVHAGQPPVRFVSMGQFTEYDLRYS